MKIDYDLKEISMNEVETILNQYDLNHENIEHLFDVIYESIFRKYDELFSENQSLEGNNDREINEQRDDLVERIEKIYLNRKHTRCDVKKYEYKDFSYMNQAAYEEILTGFKGHYHHNELWDVFLSHAYADKLKVYGVFLLLTIKYNLIVYVDWIVDRKLKRTSVTKKSVRTLQLRMHQCKSLLVVKTKNFKSSVWVPWEVGYFSGIKNTVAILGIKGKKELNYKGVEYYALYHLVLLNQHDELCVCKGTLRRIEQLTFFQDWCHTVEL